MKLKWKKKGGFRAVSDKGHEVLKAYTGEHYSVFLPDGRFKGVIYDWSDINEFLGCEVFRLPQEQQFLF